MASVSFGLNRGADDQPDKINVGTQAVSTYDIELRMNQAKGLTRTDVLLALDAFKRKIEDGRYDGIIGV